MDSAVNFRQSGCCQSHHFLNGKCYWLPCEMFGCYTYWQFVYSVVCILLAFLWNIEQTVSSKPSNPLSTFSVSFLFGFCWPLCVSYFFLLTYPVTSFACRSWVCFGCQSCLPFVLVFFFALNLNRHSHQICPSPVLLVHFNRSCHKKKSVMLSSIWKNAINLADFITGF